MLVKLLTTKAKRAIKDSFTFALPKVKVKVNAGIVRGCLEKLPNGNYFQRFSGIPYAKPPINELRFSAPQKLLKFKNEEIDCSREGNASFHKSAIWKKYVGAEDCLNLNVYVPSSASSSQKLPVMVFIHGGGLVFDSNSRDFYSPEFLLMEDVIVVTINYRLHAFGFLSLPNAGISGNAGLKDQQMALEWVHENISNFNGDPDKICLFGESAGAACTHLHLLNDKSSKFLNNAIMQSNCSLADWFFQKDGADKARRLAKLLGADENSNDEECLEVLMRAAPQKIFDNNIKAIDPKADDLRRCLPFVFKPVVEEDSAEAFITMTPAELLKTRSEPINIPMIIGLNNGDGMTMASYYRNKKLPMFDNDYIRMVPISLDIDPNSCEAEELSKQIKAFYFGDKPIDERCIKEFVKFNTDFHFTIAQTMANQLHAQYHPKGKQFVFEFCYDGELNAFKRLLKMEDVPGACHFDEIFYLFDAKLLGMNSAQDSPAWKVRAMMCKLWTNFAKHSNPTPAADNPLSFEWEPISLEDPKSIDFKFLRIDKETTMQKSLYRERTKFWQGIYDKYNGGFQNPAWRVR